MTPQGDTSTVLFAVGLLICGALATAVFGWFTSRKSVAIVEMEAALESMRIEAQEARELRRENVTLRRELEQVKKELSDVRGVALGLQREVDALKAQIGDSHA